jgi:ribosomal protein S18 acetylase RimI-like enzyme
LAVALAERGKGHGTRLIVALLDCGSTALGTTECSLFVSTSNPRAARLYERLGFTEMQYPDPTLMIPASYMVAEITAVRERSSAAC